MQIKTGMILTFCKFTDPNILKYYKCLDVLLMLFTFLLIWLPSV